MTKRVGSMPEKLPEKPRPDEPQRRLTRIHPRSRATGGATMRRALSSVSSVSAVLALSALAFVALPHAVSAQPSPNTPKFDAADISLRARTGTTNQPTMTGGVLRGG